MWGSYRREDLQDFIETGELPDDDAGDVLQYDPKVAELIAANWQG